MKLLDREIGRLRFLRKGVVLTLALAALDCGGLIAHYNAGSTSQIETATLIVGGIVSTYLVALTTRLHLGLSQAKRQRRALIEAWEQRMQEYKDLHQQKQPLLSLN